MRVRVVDYVVNEGGGLRFLVELLAAFEHHEDVECSIVSYGVAAARLEEALARRGVSYPVLRHPPARRWRHHGRRVLGIPGSGRAIRLATGSAWHYLVPRDALDECDAAWFPWSHRHRLSSQPDVPTIASYHDSITIEQPGTVSDRHRRDEIETTRRWLTSTASLAVTSKATVDGLRQRFDAASDRFTLIPLSAEHIERLAGTIPEAWTWAQGPYLLVPANISPHKNHERLFEALALLAPPRPPVALIGLGAELFGSPRADSLRRLAEALGLQIGVDLVPLGYVEDSTYGALLARAAGLVMPTLGEGGGSFPVWEAFRAGVPVACSDIPVLREANERIGGEAIYFDPLDPPAIADILAILVRDRLPLRRAAESRRSSLVNRTWADVAADYLTCLRGLVASTASSLASDPSSPQRRIG